MSKFKKTSMFDFMCKQHSAIGKIQCTANWYMFLFLFFLLGAFCFGGVIGNYSILIWLVALTVILDLFSVAMKLAEVGK